MRIEDLRDEERKYLIAAFKQNNGGPFNWKKAAESADLAVEVAQDIALSLAGRGAFTKQFLTGDTRFMADAKLIARQLIAEREEDKIKAQQNNEIAASRADQTQKP